MKKILLAVSIIAITVMSCTPSATSEVAAADSTVVLAIDSVPAVVAVDSVVVGSTGSTGK